MTLEFCEKLDLLMNVTGTTNSALAHSVTLDASHISRLRRGQRRALKDKASIAAISTFFARRCNESYRRKAVFDAMGLSRDTRDADELSELIAQWLSEDKSGGAKTVGSFLTGLTKMPTEPGPRPLSAKESRRAAGEALPELASYYGVEGKRTAAIKFLSAVAAAKEPSTLLLFSDEPTDWMTDDREFSEKWAKLMSIVLSRGNRIIIIHTISRDLDEMLHAISQWMPLYMSGAIEPYFYPKKRDGIFKRTLFIAPGIAAVVSGSVGNSNEGAANLLFGDKTAVAAYEVEYMQYLAMCRPLMRIFTARDKDACFNTLLEFENEKSDAMIKTESLSMLTMPEDVLADIVGRAKMDATLLTAHRRIRASLFENLLATSSFTEILRLPDISRVMECGVSVSLSVMFIGGGICYTPDEYLRHLKHLVHLMETYNYFCIRLIEYSADDRYMVYAKEDLGVIVAKTSAPTIVMAMREGNISAAFWDYLRDASGSKEYSPAERSGTIRKLVSYIRRLEGEINHIRLLDNA